jgi:hypothetical protein
MRCQGQHHQPDCDCTGAHAACGLTVGAAVPQWAVEPGACEQQNCHQGLVRPDVIIIPVKLLSGRKLLLFAGHCTQVATAA